MTVLLVVVGINFKRSGLGAAFRRDTLRGGLLLREHCLQFQLTELHIGTDTEEARSTLHQRVVRGEGHVTGFH